METPEVLGMAKAQLQTPPWSRNGPDFRKQGPVGDFLMTNQACEPNAHDRIVFTRKQATQGWESPVGLNVAGRLTCLPPKDLLKGQAPGCSREPLLSGGRWKAHVSRSSRPRSLFVYTALGPLRTRSSRALCWPLQIQLLVFFFFWPQTVECKMLIGQCDGTGGHSAGWSLTHSATQQTDWHAATQLEFNQQPCTPDAARP